MANFTGLAAGAPAASLAEAGWDLDRLGLAGGPRVPCSSAPSATTPSTWRCATSASARPRRSPRTSRARSCRPRSPTPWRPSTGPTIVVLQAGNLHSGAFDPFAECIAAAHEHGAWVHVDGAFGLWAAASPALRHLVDGVAGADSWATDAHKTLNVPYDCGIAWSRDPEPLRAAMGVHDQLPRPRLRRPATRFDKVPELSRRARGVPVWAALRSLGRTGVADLVDGLVRARPRASPTASPPCPGAEVLNDVVFTQVCVAFGDDARTRAVTARLLADGTAWMSGSRWQGRDVLRVSVSNWSTDEDDVAASVDAVRRAALGPTADGA